MYEVAKGFCLVLIAWLQLDTQQNPTDIRLAEVTVRIAQLVERWSNKPLVLGSIPNVTTFFSLLFSFCFAPITCTTTGAPLCGWGARVGCTRWALLCSFLFFFSFLFSFLFSLFYFPPGAPGLGRRQGVEARGKKSKK